MTEELQKAIQRFQGEMETVDELVHVLLKGHLLIEEALAEVIEQHVFHREHLSEARLSFNQKLHLCRALCLRKSNLGEWDLMAAINALRNELAHRLSSPEREKRISKIKKIYFVQASGFDGIEEIKKESDPEIILNACGHCAGFLSSFLADAKELRRYVHGLDRSLNPDLPPFEL